MDCPHCHLSMRTVEYERLRILTCESCGGEFLSPTDLAHIVQTRQELFPESIHDAVATQQPAFGMPSRTTAPRLNCPNCQSTMDEINYCGDTGIYVDRCPDCDSIWLDHAELEKLQALLERWNDEAPDKIRSIAGELEHARQEAAASCNAAFAGSRFAFVNALINRFLDAA